MLSDKPETIRQAKGFDSTRVAYADAGFCDLCAGQAAFGHSIGWPRVRPVCDSCRGLPLPPEKHGQIGATEWVNT